ncbi:divergent PAP2 family protein [Candidatus Woesearchaeota archaeon]|nr:divergent PAP2 family protein [Candidatus Woesearchaeota archaeon]
MVTFADIITNELLIGVIVTIVLAQIIKVITNAARGNKLSWDILVYGIGGMPSTHAAVVTCLTVSVLILEGISYLFVVSVVFSLLIIRDAMGVRYATGEQAKVINDLERTVWKKERVKLKESIGHTPSQVIMGIILGLIVALATVYLF